MRHVPEKGGPVMHHFPIALHPIHPESNDSEQVLALPTNRRAGESGASISAGLPRSPGAPEFAGTARRATNGPRSSTKTSSEYHGSYSA